MDAILGRGIRIEVDFRFPLVDGESITWRCVETFEVKGKSPLIPLGEVGLHLLEVEGDAFGGFKVCNHFRIHMKL